MAPNRDTSFLRTFTKPTPNVNQKPAKLSKDSLQRTISDISFELITEETLNCEKNTNNNQQQLPPIAEAPEVDAKCECCGMSEECTPQYVKKVRDKNCGRMICGLCSEAVKGEMEKNGGMSLEEALQAHVSACAGFNRLGRAYPVLCQADAMRQLLRNNRAKSLSPREKGGTMNQIKKGGITRSSSCIPAITKEFSTNEKTV